MSAEPPPTYNTPIFNQAYWNVVANTTGTSAPSSLADTLLVGNSAGSTSINMNSQNITAANSISTATLTATGTATINTHTLKPTTTNTIFNITTSTTPSGSNNAFYGLLCGVAITTGGTNSGFGHTDNLRLLTTGSSNSAFGTGALEAITTTSFNTAMGYNSCVAVTSANNTCVGAYSGSATTTGGNNTFIGYNTSSAHTTASNSTALGYLANTNNFASSTAIGVSATNTASNQIMLGTVSEKVAIPNQIQFTYTANPTLSTTSLGYSISHTGGATGLTTAYQTLGAVNLNIGVYLFTTRLNVFGASTNTQTDTQIINSTTGAYYARGASSLLTGEEGYTVGPIAVGTITANGQVVSFQAKVRAGTATLSGGDYMGMTATRIA